MLCITTKYIFWLKLHEFWKCLIFILVHLICCCIFINKCFLVYLVHANSFVNAFPSDILSCIYVCCNRSIYTHNPVTAKALLLTTTTCNNVFCVDISFQTAAYNHQPPHPFSGCRRLPYGFTADADWNPPLSRLLDPGELYMCCEFPFRLHPYWCFSRKHSACINWPLHGHLWPHVLLH